MEKVRNLRIEATKVFTFDSCHNLPFHGGKCKNIHGHTYKLEVTIAGPIQREIENSSCGMIMDFGDLKKLVNDLIIEKLDHKNLNEIYNNPTAEIMCWEIFHVLSVEISSKSKYTKISSVKLWETPDSYVKVSAQ